MIRRLHPLLHAGLAMGIAAAGRMALNSIISIGFGPELFGRYGALLSSIMIVGGTAVAGPCGAVTLGIARKWAEAPGKLPRAYLALLALITLVFLGVLVPAGDLVLGEAGAFWFWATLIYALYQLFRAFGYAVQRADVVTVCEAIGAAIPLALLPVLYALGVAGDVDKLVMIYTAGPLVFIAVMLALVSRVAALTDAPVAARERRLMLRESSIFALGSGTSTAMQFLPTVLAGQLDSSVVAAILFGALQATAPLLLLSRVYMTVMMPALASGADTAGGVEAHVGAVDRIFVPSTALALGSAPWVVVSLGIAVDPFSVATAALVAMATIFTVWATPAVTVLSAKHRELVPALASAGGLALAGAFWWVALREQSPALLAIGFVAGAFVRSLVPVWIATGRSLGAIDARSLARAALMLAMCGVVYVAGAAGTLPSLALGLALALFGLGGIARAWKKRAEARA